METKAVGDNTLQRIVGDNTNNGRVLNSFSAIVGVITNNN